MAKTVILALPEHAAIVMDGDGLLARHRKGAMYSPRLLSAARTGNGHAWKLAAL